MPRVLFSFILCLFFFSHAGFSPDTVVFRQENCTSIEQLHKGSVIVSYDEINNVFVEGIVDRCITRRASLAYKVIYDNAVYFIASPDQAVRCYDAWRTVKDLKQGDRLWCYNDSYVAVQKIHTLNDEIEFIEITVLPSHTFFVTSAGILIHNHPAIMITAAPLVTSIIPAAVGILGVASAALYSLFAKNGGHGIGRNNINSSSNCFAPPLPPDGDDEFKKKHPHGRYEDIGYHKNYQSGQKGPRPINGQEALDNSFSLGDTTFRRIGVSNRQFVVLDRTREGLYHGHVRTWDQLRQVMKNILEKQGIVTDKGKFI